MIHFRNQLLAPIKRKRNISNITVKLLVKQYCGQEGSIIKNCINSYYLLHERKEEKKKKKRGNNKLGQNPLILKAKHHFW